MTNNIFIGEPVGPIMAGPDSPIFGYKVIRIRWNSGAPVIVPPHYFNNETAFQADYHCKKTHEDSDSFQACTCGFYCYHGLEEARKHLANFRFSSNCFVTQVALSGTVIDAEKGMKSTKQRVRQIAVPPCWNCSATAEAFVEHESGYLIPSCRSCLEAQGLRPIEFSEFQRLTKLPDFNQISLLPLKNNGSTTLQRAFGNVDAREKIAQGVRELFLAGDTSGLITAKFELDELVELLMDRDNG